jgi:hypothetical protein
MWYLKSVNWRRTDNIMAKRKGTKGQTLNQWSAKPGGVYCYECYDDLNNMCTVCMNPIDYGDVSDMSEER